MARCSTSPEMSFNSRPLDACGDGLQKGRRIDRPGQDQRAEVRKSPACLEDGGEVVLDRCVAGQAVDQNGLAAIQRYPIAQIVQASGFDRGETVDFKEQLEGFAEQPVDPDHERCRGVFGLQPVRCGAPLISSLPAPCSEIAAPNESGIPPTTFAHQGPLLNGPIV